MNQEEFIGVFVASWLARRSPAEWDVKEAVRLAESAWAAFVEVRPPEWKPQMIYWRKRKL